MRITAAAAAVLLAGSAAQAAPVYATDAYIDVGKGQSVGDSRRFGPANALGPADGDFYSLGMGGGALFTFGGDIRGTASITEVTWNCSLRGNLCGNYAETAEVFGVSGPFGLVEDGIVGGVQNYDLTGLTLTYFGSVPNGAAQSGFAFDTDGKRYAGLFVRDTSSTRGDGFDIGSISAELAPVPLPPAAALLVGALAGLGLTRRRRT